MDCLEVIAIYFEVILVDVRIAISYEWQTAFCIFITKMGNGDGQRFQVQNHLGIILNVNYPWVGSELLSF